MQIESLIPKFDILQKKYWDKNLKAVYWAGETDHPEICLVFMTPTARNVSTAIEWTGLRAPWVWTKNIWKMLNSLWLLGDGMNRRIQRMKASDWNDAFTSELYAYVAKQNIYITNLSKASQTDAKHLKNTLYKSYLELFLQEMHIVSPKKIIAFGGQVNSVIYGKNIQIADWRKKHFSLDYNEKCYTIYPVYYPVWQWMRNISLAKEDITYILNN